MKINQNNFIKAFCYISGLYTLIIFLFQLIDNISYFPNNYSCREWLINYAGGFIRRGFWGQILLLLDDYIPAPYLIFILVYFSFCLITINLFSEIIKCKKISVLLGTLLITNPLSTRFYLLDEICARKDIVCLAILFIIILAIKKIFESSNTPKYLVYFSIILFLLATFLHELSLFFLFPLLAFTLLKNIIHNKFYTKTIILVFLYVSIISLFTILMSLPTTNIEQTIYKISNSWHNKYNNSFIYYKDIKDGPEIGMHYSLKQTIQRSYNSLTHSKRIVADTVLLFFFVEIFICIFLKKISLTSILNNRKYIFILLLLNTPILLCVFADDFSRWFSLTFIVDMYILISINNTNESEYYSKDKATSIYNILFALSIAFFMSLFTIENWPILLNKFIRYSNVGAFLFLY